MGVLGTGPGCVLLGLLRHAMGKTGGKQVDDPHLMDKRRKAGHGGCIPGPVNIGIEGRSKEDPQANCQKSKWGGNIFS